MRLLAPLMICAVLAAAPALAQAKPDAHKA